MKGGLIALVALLALAGLAAGRTDAAPTTRTVVLPRLETGILAELNALRGAHGLRPLALSSGLRASARAHSRSMLESGAFRHGSAEGASFSDRIRHFYPSRGFRWWSVGENLVYQSGELAAADAIAAWLDSPGHRRNMLNPAWREVGVGAGYAASAPGDFLGEATSVATVDFGARTGRR